MKVSGNHLERPGHGLASANIDALIGQLPEAELWRLLQEIIDQQVDLRDETVALLDDRMQGFLFLQDFVTNRVARIAFARSPRHMPYLRDAAGRRNVWMDDGEFTQLVELDDPATLACFARSEDMKPHHLAYIEYKLARRPHGIDLLAGSWDTRITLKKALEGQGNTRELALFRLARAAIEGCAEVAGVLSRRAPEALPGTGADPRDLWRAYLNLKSLDDKTVRELLKAAGESTIRPFRTSGPDDETLH